MVRLMTLVAQRLAWLNLPVDGVRPPPSLRPLLR
jgi:hypothetical protein